MNSYSITFINNSVNDATFCLFQQDDNLSKSPNVFPLAWFTQFVNADTQVKYTWDITYHYVWADTGNLVPGVTFEAGQTVPIGDLKAGPSITLNNNGAYRFIDNNANGATPNSITIFEDATVPLNLASVGIGMSGAGTFAVQAQPNQRLSFTPHPEYWCAFGTYSKGEVLDIQQLSNIQQVEFDPGCYNMVVTLQKDNTWVVTPSNS